MPVTRKKVIKTVYKNEDSDDDNAGDFSDSGSEAKISDVPSSEDELEGVAESSGDEFVNKNKKPVRKNRLPIKPFVKTLINKITKQDLETETSTARFTVKDLTDEDKLLPSILNLSESDSSDDESPKASTKKLTPVMADIKEQETESDEHSQIDYRDVWSQNLEQSEQIAQKAFLELEQHKNKIEEVKESVQNYKDVKQEKESDVRDLLALGEEAQPEISPVKKKTKLKKIKNESDSEVEDWEEVSEVKETPQQGIQLIVKFPDAVCRKKKTIDVEMMMKRKINRTKKETRVFMHKVHVLCWLGYGNYVSRVINDQDVMGVALSLVPSKDCYPKDRVDMKYIEQITKWYRDKLTIKQDKNEDKFKPKAPPLKSLLLEQINKKCVTTKKFFVFIFVALLRALGLQCRVMINFVTLSLKPPSIDLYSLSMKPKEENCNKTKTEKTEENEPKTTEANKKKSIAKKQSKISQMDGNDDSYEYKNIMQVDGNDDSIGTKTRSTRSNRAVKAKDEVEGVSPPKRLKKNNEPSTQKTSQEEKKPPSKTPKTQTNKAVQNTAKNTNIEHVDSSASRSSPRLSRSRATKSNDEKSNAKTTEKVSSKPQSTKQVTNANPKTYSKRNTKNIPKILVSDENNESVSSIYFDGKTAEESKAKTSRKRSHTSENIKASNIKESNKTTKTRTKSAPGNEVEKSKYFSSSEVENKRPKLTRQTKSKDLHNSDEQRVSHRDLAKSRSKAQLDVKDDLVAIIKNRIKDAKSETKRLTVKGRKIKKESDNDSDFLPEEELKKNAPESDDEFKQVKISPRPSTSKKKDRRVLSSDDEKPKNKSDVWCEIFAEELEQWIPVDVITGKIHDTDSIYTHATHPVCYVVGWDNNNYLKDLTRKYVPYYNTVTRKMRAELDWWETAIKPWLGPKTARDREEDEYLNKMQLEAPLPKTISEYKNHPLYALKRHILKFEALYPPDAATLGFVRGEAVYARDCVYICKSRDIWLKDAKTVKLGEKPYKIVKARPKWDRLSNQLIRDKVLELYGPWQVQDYEPPTAVDGIVPRNAYGNVELFKECMLPKGTVRIKLPGLNKVARKLNIDCAPAMTGFDYDGGYCHPVYDGFVVCKEFEELLTEAWVKDQEEQVKREREKTEARVYGNWKRLIRGLRIRERIKDKYGFENLSESQPTKSKTKGPRLVVKKK